MAVPLAVNTPDRLQSLPGLPTLKETGYAIPYLSWCGLSAPAKIPPEIVTKVSSAVANVLAVPAVRTKLLRTGYMPTRMNPEE
jgi:tripartite-type tricarboxylate transporter receptor subunit TctC